MPSRKQRRRREKDRRHEYEYVYVDGEGHEVEVEPEELERPKRREDRGRESRGGGKKAPAKRKTATGARKVDPPSWPKVFRRALLFAPLIYLAFSLINTKQHLATRVLLTLFYTAFFIPFMYLMDRAMYRAYLRRTGQMPASRRPGKRA